MLFSIQSIAVLASIGLASLASAVTTVPYISKAINSNCTSGTVAVTVLGECACLNSTDVSLLDTRCSSCTGDNMNADAVCVDISVSDGATSTGDEACGCECAPNTYAVIDNSTVSCYPRSGCLGDAGTLSAYDDYGYQTCTCSTGYSYVNGACTLIASANSRRRLLKSRSVAEKNTEDFFCPNFETACPIGSGYECVDTTSSLDSCGGCLTSGGVDCLAIPGSLGVSCIDSKCIVSSCFPGWSLVDGECIKN